MAHLVRAGRASRMIRFLVLLAVGGFAPQAVLSRGAGAVRNGAARQTKVIGSDRLLSVEPLAETDGQMCVPESVAASPELIASLRQGNLLSAQRQTASPLTALFRQQRSGSTRAAAASNPSPPGNSVKSQVAARKPVS